MMFSKLRIWDTEQNNGVLIYVEMADHQIEIVADRGIARHVTDVQWKAIADAMRGRFIAQAYEAGTIEAVQAVGAALALHFPIIEGERNPNELPDAPVVL
jgi:uncharacterized membrane protein